MPKTRELVINTGPILAIVAALGDLDVLRMYHHVWLSDRVTAFALTQAGEEEG
ncbi:MAG: hypothetical protein ACP5HG_17695 [Anaerolineae bacterium]